VGESPNLLILENAIVQRSSAASSKQTEAMSSQSPTQSNEGRSYEQYGDAGSQPPSTPGSVTEEHAILQEGDTGYVNFKYPFDLPDTAPNEPDTPFHHDHRQDKPLERLQLTSQVATARTTRFAPETPAMFPKPFLAGNKGQLMGASQLFGQTQPTSGLRKASPTSSRLSPNVFENNVTSPTHPTSSPLVNRGFGTTPLAPFASTSPALPEISPQPLRNGAPQWQSPMGVLDEAEEQDDDNVDETPLPKLGSRREKGGLEPIGEYRPYRKRGLDGNATRRSSQLSLDSDFEEEEAELRRQRARSNKQRASKSFPEISVPPSSDKSRVEVPSTSRNKQFKGPIRPDPGNNIVELNGADYDADSVGSQETVADSQDGAIQHQSTGGNDSSLRPTPDNRTPTQKKNTRPSSAPVRELKEKETIPETSPAGTLAELPKPISDILKETSSASSDQPALSLPTLSTDALIEPADPVNGSSRPERNMLRGNVGGERDENTVSPAPIASSPSVVEESSQQSTKHRSGRPSSLPPPLSMVTEVAQPSDPGTSSSSLSILSDTPVISSNVTQSTADDHEKESPENTVACSSPAARRGQRRCRELPTSSLPDPSPSLARLRTNSRSRRSLRKGVRQSSRHSSLSLDELERSPSDDVKPEARKLPRKSTTLREFQVKRGIFKGMVFAISMQERQPSQRGRSKPASRSELEAMIRQEGGMILEDGFSSLFEFVTTPTSVNTSATPTLSSALQLLDPDVGFTALIADSHSRKVKYMQALALGIPCLAYKWVTTCVSKREVIDWSSYLLCAGSSMLLGDAIRSRSLLPYDASTAKLAEVVSRRPKLLDGSRILLIMRKTKNEEKRLPYVFLTRVLGASLVRVHSIEEARAKLREAESGKKTFDWVYVDDHLHETRAALFGSGAGEGPSRKRKRTSTSTDSPDDLPPKRIRTLNDELVIQSLILGRLVEEEEMEE